MKNTVGFYVFYVWVLWIPAFAGMTGEETIFNQKIANAAKRSYDFAIVNSKKMSP